MKVTAADGVQVYELSAGKRLPHWLSDRKRRTLSKDADISRRVDIIQDLEFPAGCGKIKQSEDGEFILATGLHPPQVRCYELKETSMKFWRVLDSEIIQFQILSEDYSKLAFLCDNRTVCIHAKFGNYYKFRIPTPGRDMCYNPETCDLLLCGSSSEVFRFNLHDGRFQTSLRAESTGSGEDSGVEACGLSPIHGLFATCGSSGHLVCHDLRSRRSVATFDVAASVNQNGVGLTSMRFDDTGYNLGVGTETGLVALYDLRSSKPLVVKDHLYDTKIVDIKFRNPTKLSNSYSSNASSFCVLSSDRKACKLWRGDNGATITSIQPTNGGINDVLSNPSDGLLMLGCDSPKIQVYFVPMLGPAPKWSSYLENVTEELDESFKQTEVAPSAYDDYRFVTREGVKQLGLSHLLGTPVMRAYMHGFFVDNRLYHKAKSLSDPFAYDRYRQQVVNDKLEEERKSRISIAKKMPKINARLASKLQEDKEKEEEEEEEGGDKASQPKSLLDDDRFASLFKDERFKIDEESEEYRMLHPNAPTTKKPRFAKEDESSDEEEQEGDEDAGGHLAPKMYYGRKHDEIASMPLDQRVNSQDDGGSGLTSVAKKITGSREMTYFPEEGRKSRKDEGAKRESKSRRRRKMGKL
ncbi:nucleolar protein 10 [Chloropicon primus]|uniref:Uncharacterized protein n=1 Tax=Chloropicon primus TaxID=1764295 RepID=A0A5B8MYF2_9CHLO|nr:hypothetical protein A3770_18p80950 [Chloropicon primus]UPR04774.1 nucleolar protein 10 [Chloropicon primus]|eukprot:QDZ25577.1 hypothetical protein A3770_18p80950 [Chloropicon primus]